jgi:propanol-preferring alcohol dehydrogenase
MVQALAFAAEGEVKANIELQPLASVYDIRERVELGEDTSRVVIEFFA